MTETQSAASPDREYETIYILRSEVTKDSSEGISSRIADVVSREGGKLTRIENWGRRKLAYPVGKQKRGVYVYLKYIGRGGVVSEIERNLRMLDDVLKYQTVKLREEVARESVVVAPEDLKFEHIEVEAGTEEEDSLARELGLEDRREGEQPRRHGFGDEGEDYGRGEDEVAASNLVGGEDDE